MKPRIRIIQNTHHQRYRWVCIGAGITGFGETHAHAFVVWSNKNSIPASLNMRAKALKSDSFLR